MSALSPKFRTEIPDWPEVAEWLFEKGTLTREEVVRARIVKGSEFAS